MIATIPYIKEKFEEFNRQMFDGKLPMPAIELSRAKRSLGMCVAKKRRTLLGKVELYDFKLRISSMFDLPEREMEDTIIHEMIHYYIDINKLKDSSAHGPLFRQMMESINKRFGRNITISYKSSKEQLERICDAARRWHVVAVMDFKDGRTGIKVLPRVMPKIIYFCQKVTTDRVITNCSLYLTDEPFFNQFPTSTAFRINIVEKDLLEKHLAEAERLRITGSRVLKENQ